MTNDLLLSRRTGNVAALASAMVAAGLVLFYRLCFGIGIVATYEDDFFYYLKAAINLSTLGRTTFDGIHLTNGYHPLWLLMLAMLYRIHGGMTFFIELQCLLFSLVMITFLMSRKLFSCYTDDWILPNLLAVILTFYDLLLSFSGMEVALVLPAIVCLLWYRLRPAFTWNIKSILGYGFIASIVILSRLDAVILIVLLLGGELFTGRALIASKLRNLLLFGTGAFLVPSYMLLNLVVFHTISPVSGQAKELRFHHFPSIIPIRTLFVPNSSIKVIILWTSLVSMVLCARWLVQGRIKASNWSFAFPALLCFPLVHLLLVSMLSDWPLWIWYLYPWVVSLAGCGIVLCDREARQGWARGPLQAVLVAACALSMISAFFVARSHTPQRSSEYLASMQIASYIKEHPGIYGMGDRSGMVGYLAASPVLQLEGLMMDKNYLENIRQQRDLLSVLKSYGVRYYVGTMALNGSQCWDAVEPAQGGPDSPKMKSKLCSDNAVVFRNNGFDNVIIDLTRLQ